jgi:hypothetical protein
MALYKLISDTHVFIECRLFPECHRCSFSVRKKVGGSYSSQQAHVIREIFMLTFLNEIFVCNRPVPQGDTIELRMTTTCGNNSSDLRQAPPAGSVCTSCVRSLNIKKTIFASVFRLHNCFPKSMLFACIVVIIPLSYVAQ